LLPLLLLLLLLPSDNTLHNDRHFWSSTGSLTQVGDEGLLFELSGPAARMSYLQLAVYRAFYQAG
jgi:hypothetical protein